MYKHIMLPVDGTELSSKAVDECFALAKPIGAKVSVIHVVPHFHVTVPVGFTSDLVKQLENDREKQYKQRGEKMVEELESRAKASGIDCDGTVVVGDNPYEEIIEQAEKTDCDLIMMASHGRSGLDALLLGSETAKVLTHTRIPVLIVR
jgi:nucleotide-binding universal stress UspA family protein